MIELGRENVCMGESSVAVFSQLYCEADVIVPDTNPDISKVLQVSANAGISNKSCGSDRITVDGRTDFVIIYLGDDGGVYSINANQPFAHIIDAVGTNEEMYAEVEVNVDNVDYTILNSRKMNIKALLGIDANAVSDVSASVCTNLYSDEPVEILSKTINPYKTVSRTTEQLCIRERLDIPTGKPSIDRILRADATIRDKSCSLAENKMMIQGILCVSVVYLGDVDGKINTAEYEIPFTEVIGMSDVDETMTPSVKLFVNKLYYKPECDDDGDLRYIMIECMISANAKVCCGYNINMVQDVYSVKHPIKIAGETVQINKLVTEHKSQISSKDVVVLTDDMPEILQIFNICPHAFLGTARIEGKKAIVEGIIETDIMYLSTDEKSPLNTHKHQQQFSHTIDIPEGGEDMVCDVQIDITHSSYTISLGREIDLRFVMELCVNVLKSERMTYITDIESDNTEQYDAKKTYCIKIYFVKKGDSLWSIAKKYRITKESLMEINNITTDSEMFDGRQIMIPIK